MTRSSPWPESVFDAAALRGLDENSRAAVRASSRLHTVAADDTVFHQGDPGESFYVVVSGSVVLSALRRGDDEASVIRVARRGDTFGEEATSTHLRRRVTAVAGEDSRLAEIPMAVFRRVTGRQDDHRMADRERRILERAATRDLLATLAFTRDLPADDLDMAVDGARLEHVDRGERIYSTGEPAEDFFLLVEGLVQIQSETEEGVRVRAYLGRGDFFGDEEIIAGEPRSLTAVAMGEGVCLRLPGPILRTLSDRNPGLLKRLRRISSQKRADQGDLIAGASSTQHVFRDLYRMQMARSLLVIDQDTCVRCGHCAWSCAAVHGRSRLIRRGDKVITRRQGGADSAMHRLLLPNTCQHCKNAACMIDCPTGAIGRDPEGEVFIRDDLCTGCANCAKACPWENIRMAPRPVGPEAGPRELSLNLAVKCDLCRDYLAPACVQACPTGSIARVDPSRDFAEVRRLLGGGSAVGAGTAAAIEWSSIARSALIAIALAALVLGWSASAAGHLHPGSGWGLAAGVAAAAMVVALAAYSLPKRLVRRWMRPRDRTGPLPRTAVAGGDAPDAPDATRSRIKPWLRGHIVLGFAAMAGAAAHAGPRFPASAAGMLHVAFWLTALVGVVGAFLYAVVPRRLAGIESRGALPEDLGREREALMARLYRQTTGRSDLVKAITQKLLIPYARAPLGALALTLSGRTLAAERRRLRGRIATVLDGRGNEPGRLAGVDDLIRTVVEMRALPARRWLTRALRIWLPVHIVSTGVLGTMLVLHIAGAVMP